MPQILDGHPLADILHLHEQVLEPIGMAEVSRRIQPAYQAKLERRCPMTARNEGRAPGRHHAPARALF